MSLGDADAKFPDSKGSGLPPSPSRENPGQVYPKSDPNSAPAETIPGSGGEREPQSVLGNPFALNAAFTKLHSALDGAIVAIENEAGSVGTLSHADGTLRKLIQWRTELGDLWPGIQPQIEEPDVRYTDRDVPQEGGLFVD